eukprot:TRINITY_DN14637_c0_g1_i1.p1 TRINITY_DN14637_c0_g1~~TRINITY_DN14637_c0_g1_i1.p1  ORF type:complete len:232 (+),score=16.15 TRINITY_DN14637_c0_g1_i1:88-783(+)
MSWSEIPSIELYYAEESSACRSVLMCIKELELDVDLHKVDIYQKFEQRKPWFMKMNPQHTVPTITDRDTGLVLWESRAILQYLANKYGDGKASLYPRDPDLRATVDRILFFDLGCLSKSIVDYFNPQVLAGEDADEVKGNALKQALEYLDLFLQETRYVAGETLTIADLSVLGSITQLESMDFRIKAYGNVFKWVERLKLELPYYEDCNLVGIEKHRAWAKNQRKTSRTLK